MSPPTPRSRKSPPGRQAGGRGGSWRTATRPVSGSSMSYGSRFAGGRPGIAISLSVRRPPRSSFPVSIFHLTTDRVTCLPELWQVRQAAAHLLKPNLRKLPVADHRSSTQTTTRPGTRSSAASIASRGIEPWPPGTTNSRSATRLPSSSPPSTSGCDVLVRRQLEHPNSPTASGIDGLTDRMHPQFGHDPFGGVVAHLSDAEDPLQPSLFEPEPYNGRSGLGGQALPPVGTSQPTSTAGSTSGKKSGTEGR